MQKSKINEGLRAGDLAGQVSHRFTVDQYKSKMGPDEDVVVLAFRVKDKFPAIDLMEFIEKSFPFVLDADISSGEEANGTYTVFVEFERGPKVPTEIFTLLQGIDRLCSCKDWYFRYFKETHGQPYTVEAGDKVIPTTPSAYQALMHKRKNVDAKSIIDKGIANVDSVDDDNNIVFNKPHVADLTAKLESIGDYASVSKKLKGGIQLDESSVAQVSFLQRYLGPYEVSKINNKFLIKNGNKAMIIKDFK